MKEEETKFIYENNLTNFRQLELYESFTDIINLKEKVQAVKLYGNNGEINEKEFDKISLKN